MDRAQTRQLLEELQRGEHSIDDALHALAQLPGIQTAEAHLDSHRQLRTGHPEVIYGAGKSAAQIIDILHHLHDADLHGIVTRVSAEKAAVIQGELPDILWHATPRILHLQGPAPLAVPGSGTGTIAVICAGTSDLPVAEEAAVIAEAMGHTVSRFRDIGVAGLHRLLGELDALQEAAVLIVVAGMEGALPSVVAGLLPQPVIAVPTSVGYGASFGGLAALLGMLNACAEGISVVNIDNGYGAAITASLILHTRRELS